MDVLVFFIDHSGADCDCGCDGAGCLGGILGLALFVGIAAVLLVVIGAVLAAAGIMAPGAFLLSIAVPLMLAQMDSIGFILLAMVLLSSAVCNYLARDWCSPFHQLVGALMCGCGTCLVLLYSAWSNGRWEELFALAGSWDHLLWRIPLDILLCSLFFLPLLKLMNAVLGLLVALFNKNSKSTLGFLGQLLLFVGDMSVLTLVGRLAAGLLTSASFSEDSSLVVESITAVLVQPFETTGLIFKSSGNAMMNQGFTVFRGLEHWIYNLGFPLIFGVVLIILGVILERKYWYRGV